MSVLLIIAIASAVAGCALLFSAIIVGSRTSLDLIGGSIAAFVIAFVLSLAYLAGVRF